MKKPFIENIYRQKLLKKHFKEELYNERIRIREGANFVEMIPNTRRATVAEVELDESLWPYGIAKKKGLDARELENLTQEEIKDVELED